MAIGIKIVVPSVSQNASMTRIYSRQNNPRLAKPSFDMVQLQVEGAARHSRVARSLFIGDFRSMDRPPSPKPSYPFREVSNGFVKSESDDTGDDQICSKYSKNALSPIRNVELPSSSIVPMSAVASRTQTPKRRTMDSLTTSTLVLNAASVATMM